MKKSLILIAALSLLGTGAIAATPELTSKTEIKSEKKKVDRVVHRGFRVSA
jgi:hypothetical protein